MAEPTREEFAYRADTSRSDARARRRRAIPIPKGDGALGRTAVTLEPVQVPDITVPGVYTSRVRQNLIESGKLQGGGPRGNFRWDCA